MISGVFDGDTPVSQRRRIQAEAHLVLDLGLARFQAEQAAGDEVTVQAVDLPDDPPPVEVVNEDGDAAVRDGVVVLDCGVAGFAGQRRNADPAVIAADALIELTQEW